MADDGFLDRLGQVFTGGLQAAVGDYLAGSGRFRSDTTYEYTALPDGRLIDNRTQRAAPSAGAVDYRPWLIAGGALLAVVVLVAVLKR